ncbi:MAG: flagellar biosynthesis protein FliQ [Alphaproteobacteria bacterium]|nr:flagellar biosynthesis protein FliQ [Alphaproteobacteria bacterium]
MAYEQFIAIGHETLLSTVLTVTPVLLAGLVVGLIIGIFQAATSINEATLAFVPKLFIVGIVLLLAGPFMMATITSFFQTVFAEIGRINR